LFTRKLDGNDVLQVYDAARQAVERARAGQGPSFLDCKTYRILGHAGCLAQDAKGYRPQEEVEEWKSRCPLATFEKKLLGEGLITQDEIQVMERQIDGELDEAFECARRDPLPSPEDLSLYLFCERN
jgi:pyruvate dehydrogenase E1 component alpha subunit